jgi:phytoene desaturase
MIKAAPALMKYQAWRSVYSIVSSFVKDEKLRQALSFHTLLVGGNPMTTSAIYALIHKLEKDGGVWFAKGGTNKLVAAWSRLFERLGGTLRLGDPVVEIETQAATARDRGATARAAGAKASTAVACNADIMHSYRDLLGLARGAAWRRAGSQALLALAVRRPFRDQGHWPGIPHHMILFGPRYKELLTDIYEPRRAARRFLALSPPPERHRSEHGARGHARPSTRWRRCRISASCRSTGMTIRSAMPIRILDEIERRLIPGLRADRHPLPATRRRFRARSERASGLGVQPRAFAHPAPGSGRTIATMRFPTSISSAPARIRAPAFPAWSGAPRRRPRLMLEKDG